jgi:dGTPase
MVNDLLGETRQRTAGMGGPADIRAAGRATAAFSPELAANERRLKAFMYERLYLHPEQLATARKAGEVIATLFAAYSAEPDLMGPGWAERLREAEPDRSRHIADYLAGMTDRFAIAAYARITGITPEGLRNV